VIPGYGGRILRINLSDKKTTTEPTPDDLIKDYVGARGFIIHTLYTELAPGIDPLGPDAKFITATGPLTGLYLPSSKPTRAAISPRSSSWRAMTW
jgi:aldehyde:ferredoxin oxidoreductase